MKTKRDLWLVLGVSALAISLLPIGIGFARQRRQAEAWEYFNYGPDRNGACKAANLRILRRGMGDNNVPIGQWTELENAQFLSAAIIYNDPATVQAIINKGVNVNSKMEHGITALHIAVAFRRADMVKVLLRNGADANAEVEGKTPLGYMDLPPKGNRFKVGTDQQIIQMLNQANHQA